MIKVKRTRLESLGECRGFSLRLEFDTDLSDRQFERFVDALDFHLEPLRVVNLAARITERVVEIDTSDVLGALHFLRDVWTALNAAGCEPGRPPGSIVVVGKSAS